MRSHDIVFLAVYGDEYRIVKITAPNGAGTDVYHLMMDKYYKGSVVKRDGKWVVLLQNDNGEYTSADFDVIDEIMTSQTS